MTPEEHKAFVAAYGRNVAIVNSEAVADFVRQYSEGVDLDYCGDYVSVMDALMMWNSAIKFNLEQTA